CWIPPLERYRVVKGLAGTSKAADDIRQHFARLATYRPIGHHCDCCLLGIDLDHVRPMALGDQRKGRCRRYDGRGSDTEKYIAFRGSRQRYIEGVRGDTFAEPNNIRTQIAA